MTETTGNLAALLQDAINHHEPRLYRTGEGLDRDDGPSVLLAPDGMTAIDLKPFYDAYRDRPIRARGVIRAADLPSLIDLALRYSEDNRGAALFCSLDPAKPMLQALFNWHEPEATSTGLVPGYGDHRAVYDFPLSEAWKAWAKADGEKFSQLDFAAFLEERILDVIHPPAGFTSADETDGESTAGDAELARLLKLLGGRIAGPTTMMELSRGLELHATSLFKERRNLASGEDVFAYEETHSNAAGKPVKVPQIFLIEIPVFDNGQPQKIAVRLRYRISSGAVTWFFQRARVKETFEAAVRAAANEAQKASDLPLFFGLPES